MLCRALNELIQRDAEFSAWLPRPRTVMIKKQQENPAPQDHRPITCLNNIHKVVTSIINEALKSHEKFQQLPQLDQRGSKPGSMGCIDNLLDKAILEDAKTNRKNLSCTWIDIQKVFGSVSHSWLIRILEMHGLE